MLRTYLILSVIITAIVSACSSSIDQPDDDTTTSKEIPYLVDSLLLDNGNYCFLQEIKIQDNNVFLFIENYNERKGWIECRDKNSLELIWSWQEAYDEFGSGAYGFFYQSYIYNDVLCTAHRNLSYGIDINTGNTLWKNRDIGISGRSLVHGHKEIIVRGATKEHNEHTMMRTANINDGEWTPFYEQYRDDSLYIQAYNPTIFEWQNDTYIAFVNSKWKTGPNLEMYWLNLYNLSQHRMEWTSDTIPLFHPLSGVPNGLTFHEGQLLLANDALYSYNVEDGSLEWRKFYGNSVVAYSQPAVHNGIIYANNESLFFIGVDVHTGEEIFNVPSGGTASDVVYHNNTCIMTQLTSGPYDLIVYDANNGSIIKGIDAPFLENWGENKKWFFDDVCAVDPETNHVYTADHRYLLVYNFDQ